MFPTVSDKQKLTVVFERVYIYFYIEILKVNVSVVARYVVVAR